MTFLYMVKMVDPLPVEFCVSDSWDIKDDFIHFRGIEKSSGGHEPTSWKYIFKPHVVSVECLGKCDREGNLLEGRNNE